jgi:nitroreductase
MTPHELKNLITNSTKTQRNWDRSKSIPEEHLETMIHAVTQCPSKQNEAYYTVDVITNPDVIDKIFDCTSRSKVKPDEKKNAQVLANAVFAFSWIKPNELLSHNNETDILNILSSYEKYQHTYHKHTYMSMGIAISYLNLTAHMLGYKTGFCACIEEDRLKTELGMPQVTVLLGVGYPDPDKSRLQHQHLNAMYRSYPKAPVQVNRIK